MGCCCSREEQYVQAMMGRIPKSSGIFREHSYDVVAYALRSHYNGGENLALGCTYYKVFKHGVNIQSKDAWLMDNPRCPKLRKRLRKLCCKKDDAVAETSRVNVYW